MYPLKIAICEDDKHEQENIISILHEIDIFITYTIFDTAEEFLQTYTSEKYDLLLMDVYLKGITGVDAVSKIRKIDKFIPIAFTTISQQHAVKAYELKVNEYFIKPLQKNKVLDFLELVQNQRNNIPKFHVKINNQEISLPFHDILYLEQKSNNIFIFLQNNEPLCAKCKLSELEKTLDSNIFFRSHISFLVNLGQVKKIDKELIAFEMKNGSLAYIRRENMTLAQKAFHNYRISRQLPRL